MEIRRDRNHQDTKTFGYNVRFSEVDVRRTLVKMYGLYYINGLEMDFLTREAIITDILKNLSEDLKKCSGGKYVRPLAEWGFNCAVESKYLVSDDGKYFSLSPTLKDVVERENPGFKVVP